MTPEQKRVKRNALIQFYLVLAWAWLLNIAIVIGAGGLVYCLVKMALECQK